MDFCHPENQLDCLKVYSIVSKTLTKRYMEGKSSWQAETKKNTLYFSQNSF